MVTTKCPVCHEPTERPVEAAFEHFRFYDLGQLRYWRGNIKAFGWSGIQASLCLSFPFYNTIINWKHRKSQLGLGASKASRDKSQGDL